MFARDKPIGPYTYVYLVENVREDGRSKQRIIANLGRKEVVSARRPRPAGALTRPLGAALDGALRARWRGPAGRGVPARSRTAFCCALPPTEVAGKLFQAVGIALPPNRQELASPSPLPIS
jgi:hypothetical protein